MFIFKFSFSSHPPTTTTKRLNAIISKNPNETMVDIEKILLNFHGNAKELE